jgi:cell shape-determining protein MreC
VTEVYQRSSIVTLFSSPGVLTSVVIGPSHIQATAEGKGGGNFEAVLPRGVAVQEGDAILMPGINPLLFGTILKILAAPSDSFQTILFKNPVNMFELYYLELVPK